MGNIKSNSNLQQSLKIKFKELDKLHVEWKQMHAYVAQTYIGSNDGTGGSSGVKFLQDKAKETFFSEIL